MNNDRLRAALKNVHRKLAQEEWFFGFVGRHNPDDSYTYQVRGRANYIYVTLRLSSGAQTVTVARNDAGVPFSANLPVRMRSENGLHIIDGVARRDDLATVEPSPGSGVPIHIHDDRYFRENEHIATSAGVADAGKPVIANPDGLIDPSLIDEASIVEDAISGAATDDTIDDADLFPRTTGGTLVKTAWSNIKTVFTTYYNSVVATLTNKSISGATNTITALPTMAYNDDSVTYAKMQNIATDSLIGRDTAGTGDPETISLNATLSMTGSGALQREALTGDVTASAGSNTTAIANDAVSNAKAANMAANTVKANNTGSTADPADVDVATLLAQYGVVNGTWSPAITTSGVAPTTLTYTEQVGRYTSLFGVIVFYSFRITINTLTLGPGTGDIRVSLPLTNANVNNADLVRAAVSLSGLNAPASTVSQNFRPQPGQAYGLFQSNIDDAGAQNVAIADAASGDILGAAGFYWL